ncbi:MAG: peptidylprolyl isomerase [Desulfobulbaceae bacterium]|nr:peptidylprolyl isomerase [Desulfobulbaceae bacterium]
MLLKEEEIDGKINIDEADLRRRYDEKYAPLQLTRLLFFTEEKQAKAVYEELRAGKSTVAEFKDRRPDQGGPVHYQETWLRPHTTPVDWQKPLANLKTGDYTDPLAWKNGFAILSLEERKDGSMEDLETTKKQIHKELRGEQETRLTVELVKQLRKKYAVEVDQDLVAAVDVDNLSEELADKPVLKTAKGPITAKDFVETIRKEHKFRKDYGFKKEEMDEIKQRVLNGIINQTVISWEAQDRHYEEKPPFQSVYNFYRQHRLIKELEERLFSGGTLTVDESEIAAYHQAHQEEFITPEIVTLAVLTDEGNKAEKVWIEVTLGNDFFALADKYYGHPPRTEQTPVDHLDPLLKEVVAKLAKNEVSPPFQHNGSLTMVKLLDRKAENPIPLAHLSKMIAEKLRKEKSAKLRTEFLMQLKSKSSISVDEDAWQAVKKELGDKDENNNQ